MSIIDKLEPHRRGPYGGGIGHVSFTGSMDMALGLRTMIIPTAQVGTCNYIRALCRCCGWSVCRCCWWWCAVAVGGQSAVAVGGVPLLLVVSVPLLLVVVCHCCWWWPRWLIVFRYT